MARVNTYKNIYLLTDRKECQRRERSAREDGEKTRQRIFKLFLEKKSGAWMRVLLRGISAKNIFECKPNFISMHPSTTNTVVQCIDTTCVETMCQYTSHCIPIQAILFVSSFITVAHDWLHEQTLLQPRMDERRYIRRQQQQQNTETNIKRFATAAAASPPPLNDCEWKWKYLKFLTDSMLSCAIHRLLDTFICFLSVQFDYKNERRKQSRKKQKENDPNLC